MSAPRQPRKTRHVPSYESMIAWGCVCGARWMNEELRRPDGSGARVQKSDEELIEERDIAFAEHEREMKAKGYGA